MMVVVTYQGSSKAAEESALATCDEIQREMKLYGAEITARLSILETTKKTKSATKLVAELKRLISELPTIGAEVPRSFSFYEQLLGEQAQITRLPCIDERTFVRIGTPCYSPFFI